jgi:hypothetical protein
MAYEVTCSHCSARFSLTADLYARRIKGRISTIRCPRCSKDTTIDDSAGKGTAASLKPLNDADSARRPEPISERRISHSDASPQQLVAVSEPAAPAANKLQPPPVPRKTPEVSRKALWIVSYAEEDDRELTVLQIRSALVRGEVTRDTLVWQEGMPAWVPMAQVAELAALLPRPTDVLKHRMPLDKSPRRPSSRPPPKPDVQAKMPAIPGLRAVKPPLPPNKPAAPLPDGGSGADEKPHTRPDLPKPRSRNQAAEPQDRAPAPHADADAGPPSSGSPALRSLTQQASGAATQRSAEELLLGMQSADPGLLSLSGVEESRLTAAAVEEAPAVGAVTRVAPPERRRMSSASDAAAGAPDTIEDLLEAPARASKPPRIEAAQPAGDPQRTRSSLPWVVLLAGLCFGVAWLLWAGRAREARETPPAVVAAKPADPVARQEPAMPAPPNGVPVEQADASGAAVETESLEHTTRSQGPRRRAPAPVAAGDPVPSDTPAAPATRPASAAEQPPAEQPPAEPPVVEAPRPTITSPFDKVAAVSALNNLAGQASACRQAGDPSGIATVVLTFAPSGRVTNATVNGPPFAGTPTGGCVARTLRRAQVPPFAGDHVTVSKSVLVQ